MVTYQDCIWNMFTVPFNSLGSNQSMDISPFLTTKVNSNYTLEIPLCGGNSFINYIRENDVRLDKGMIFNTLIPTFWDQRPEYISRCSNIISGILGNKRNYYIYKPTSGTIKTHRYYGNRGIITDGSKILLLITICGYITTGGSFIIKGYKVYIDTSLVTSKDNEEFSKHIFRKFIPEISNLKIANNCISILPCRRIRVDSPNIISISIIIDNLQQYVCKAKYLNNETTTDLDMTNVINDEGRYNIEYIKSTLNDEGEVF